MNIWKSILGIVLVAGGAFFGGALVEDKFDIYQGKISQNSENSPQNNTDEISGKNAKNSEKSPFSWLSESSYLYLKNSEKKDITKDVSLEKVNLVYSLLKKYHNDSAEISDKKLEEWLVRGVMYSSEDPYSEFFNEEQGDDFEKNMAGDFEGIGAALEKRKENLLITEVLKGLPAAQSGLLPGDVIVKVDDKLVEDETVWEAVMRIRGEKGTTVKIEVFRGGKDGGLKTFDVKRDTIHVESVEFSWKGEEKNIAVFEISQFGDEMIAELKKNLKKVSVFQKEGEISGKKLKGIVIDLRYNGGGYLTGAVDLASFFLPENTKIVSVKKSSGEEEVYETEKSFFGAAFSDTKTPLVVLINGGSASASEIFAGSIAEKKRGTLIGTKSYGKGSVQEIFPLEKNPNEFVKITIAKWLLPSGRNLTHEEPLVPEVEVKWDRSKMTDEQVENHYDPQMEKAVEFLEKK